MTIDTRKTISFCIFFRRN